MGLVVFLCTALKSARRQCAQICGALNFLCQKVKNIKKNHPFGWFFLAPLVGLEGRPAD